MDLWEIAQRPLTRDMMAKHFPKQAEKAVKRVARELSSKELAIWKAVCDTARATNVAEEVQH
jgi:hypothetical protein